MTKYFYAPSAAEKSVVDLSSTEAHHVANVLRLKQGDSVTLLDGNGGVYNGEIHHVSKREVSVKVVSFRQEKRNKNYRLHIAIAPTKSSDRFDFFLEKAAETGVDEITPILTHHSERRKINRDKLEQTLIASIKQSGNPFLPKLNDCIYFKDFIGGVNNADQKYICHCLPGDKIAIPTIPGPAGEVVFLVGPEGDFTTEEVHLAKAGSFIPVELGEERLRTETAGIFISVVVKILGYLK